MKTIQASLCFPRCNATRFVTMLEDVDRIVHFSAMRPLELNRRKNIVQPLHQLFSTTGFMSYANQSDSWMDFLRNVYGNDICKQVPKSQLKSFFVNLFVPAYEMNIPEEVIELKLEDVTEKTKYAIMAYQTKTKKDKIEWNDEFAHILYSTFELSTSLHFLIKWLSETSPT